MPALRHVFAVIFMMLAVAACGTPVDPGSVPELPETTPAGFRSLLEDSQIPVLVNVWGSWCVPCRSEAPLLREASERFAGRVRFIGVDVRDTQAGARSFIAEFGLDFEHFFDPSSRIASDLGGFGVPVTYFIAPGGEPVTRHDGVIDERTLALNLDELVAGAG